MVYKKYIKRGNKIHGPYYYESYRDESGKIKKRYVGTSANNSPVWKSKEFYILLGFAFVLLFFGGLRMTGFVAFEGNAVTEKNVSITGEAVLDDILESTKQGNANIADSGKVGEAVGKIFDFFKGEESPSIMLEPGDDEAEQRDYFLDVGGTQDDNSSRDIYLSTADVSEIIQQGGVSYREIDHAGYLYFYINASNLSLDEYGVPFSSMVLHVRYNDTIDENDCSSSYLSPGRSQCRPRVESMLDYGKISDYSFAGLGGLETNEWTDFFYYIERAPWTFLQAKQDRIAFRIYNNDYLYSQKPLPIDFINITFVNSSAIKELKEIDRAARFLYRRDVNDTFPVESSEPIVIYKKNYLERIFPGTRPEQDEFLNNISLFEIAGNTEPFSIGVFANEDIDVFNISLTDLVSDNSRINSEDIQINKVVYQDLRYGSLTSSSYGTNPGYLDDFSPSSLDINKSYNYWLSFNVPEDAEPGEYHGVIKFTADDSAYSFDVFLKVYRVDLTEESRSMLAFSDLYYDIWTNANETIVDLKNMKDHNIVFHPIFTPIYSFSSGHLVSHIDYSNEIEKFSNMKNLGLIHNRTFIYLSDASGIIWDYNCGGSATRYELECPVFEQEFTNLLHNHTEFLAQFGITEPIYSFGDEPGEIISKRRSQVYKQRIAQKAGYETWVTYSEASDKPVVGYEVTFNDYDSVDYSYDYPPWILSDPDLVSYWNFESDYSDITGHGHDGTPFHDVYLEDGYAHFDGQDDYISLNGNMDLGPNMTAIVWLRPNDPGKTSSYVFGSLYRFILNYYFDGHGEFRAWSREDYRPTLSSNTDCSDNKWCFLAGTYDDSTGTQSIYLNDELQKSNYYRKGEGLAASTHDKFIGGRGAYGENSFSGSIADVFLFNRTLSTDEITGIFVKSGLHGLNKNQKITLSLTTQATSPYLYFAIDDEDGLGVNAPTKRLYVNGNLAWEKSRLDYPYQKFNVSIGEYLVAGENNIYIEVENNNSIRNLVMLYFMDKVYRDQPWEVTTNSENWEYTYYPDDENGNLMPMNDVTDYQIYIVGDLDGYDILRTKTEGGKLSYYTTYHATMPVILYNRFLNGYYATAINTSVVDSYSYSSITDDPYDDLSMQWWGAASSPAGIRGTTDYSMVYPSWESGFKNKLIFESLREGIEDQIIADTLMKKASESSSTLAREATNYVNSVFGKISNEFYPKYALTGNSEDFLKNYDTSENILTDLSGNSSDYEVFDRIREQMIKYIILLDQEPDSPREDGGDGSDGGGGGGGGSSSLPQCNDGIDNDQDGFIDFPGDLGCTSLSDNDETDKSAIGAGYFCEELWSCGDWGDCINGMKTRECYDMHYCGTEEDKPDLEELCATGTPGGARYDILFILILIIVSSGTLGIGLIVWYLKESKK